MPLIPKQQPPYYETGSATEGIKYYTALLTQDGTVAPVATVMQNTIGTLTWSYTGVGVYTLTGTGLFLANKTFIRVTMNRDPIAYAMYSENNFPNELILTTEEAFSPYNLINGALFETPIEIRIYP